jgi:chromate transport protein ChrA
MFLSADIWIDIRIILTLVLFVYIIQWAISQTGSKKMGVIVGSIVAYLTVYRHWEFIVLIVVFFFGYNFFYRLEEASRIGYDTGGTEVSGAKSFRADDRKPYVEGGKYGTHWGPGWYSETKRK